MSSPENEPSFSGDFSQLSHWIDAARNGSEDALEKIIDGCRGYLLQIANQELDSDLRGKVAPSDVVQESFVDAQQHLGTFRGESERELLGWMKEILLNNIRNTRRAYHQTQKRQVSREVPMGDGNGQGAPEVALDSLSVGAKTVAAEEAKQLQQALERLPEDYRQAVQLRNWERLSFGEIGNRLDRSEEAARKLWSRAIEQLQQELEHLNGPSSS